MAGGQAFITFLNMDENKFFFNCRCNQENKTKNKMHERRSKNSVKLNS